MNDSITCAELARLSIAKTQDVLLARFVGRDEATKMGFPPAMLTRLATAISEITRNVVQHAGCPGFIRIGQLSDGERLGLRIVVSDKGKGMEHPEQFIDDSKISGLGAGLLGTRKLVDTFSLQSAPGEGTTVTLEIWVKKATL